MSYIDGFIIAAPSADREKIVEHAERMDRFFIDYGATRVVEGWGDDVPTARSPISARRSRPRTTRT